MSDTLSAKILRKKVDDDPSKYYGKIKIGFLVYVLGDDKQMHEEWLSAFVKEGKDDPALIALLRELGEGDRATFYYERVPGKGKDGKPTYYYNIKGVERETQIHDDVPGATPAVQPDGRKPREAEPDGVKARSVALSYAKDEEVAIIRAGGQIQTPDEVIYRAKRYEQYINTGE